MEVACLEGHRVETGGADRQKSLEVMDDALRVADKIRRASDRDEVIRKIARELAQVKVQRTLETVKRITDERVQSRALAEIARELAKTEPEEALKIAAMILFLLP
ncbi:MAG: hypothetical protein V2G42_09250 [bacterium JZ-2024 1]